MIFADREKKFYAERNSWLEVHDFSMQKFCSIENFQSTGKGGQKRNKTRSAVRLIHIPTELSITADNFREQNLNRKYAESKLRLKLAMQISGPEIKLNRNIYALDNFEYPLFVAFLLDNFYFFRFEVSPIAEKLSISNSKLLKLIYRDRTLWEGVNELRVADKKHRFSI